MRIAIISDIHGNQVALEAVLEDLGRQPAIDQIVIAGDLCLNGPRPREVLNIVQQLGCPVIKGNVDEEVVTAAPEKGRKKQSTVAWTREQIGPAGIAYLRELPFSYRVTNPGGSDALIVHANPHNLEEAIAPNASDQELERLLAGLDEGIGALAFGHLHIAYRRRWRHLLLLDVASCGLPRDGDQRAAYGILSWQGSDWEGEIRRVPYDLEAVIAQIRASGMPYPERRIKILREAHY
ncbi:metallophosphoesterase family protein [Thermogemmatispora sp.]|uniref:metallophosphoesterase family protein n=1 Tax=Thermogemmatispora sp. TaxID=1968838 RepID=UPI002631317C|nr:metallophosphoesterase family protein [Thermogemmatispora sp.]